MFYSLLADIVVLLHMAFVLFAVLGGILVLGWPKAAWVHLPAALWAALIEFGGWFCPLTPLENRLRMLAGGREYAGGFLEHYVLPVLYPMRLTREVQVALGVLVIAVNLAIYGIVLTKRKRAG
jgi:hypothetical protein